MPLRPADLALGGRGQMCQIAVLDPDEIGFAQGKVEVKVDEAIQRLSRIGVPRGHVAGTGEQAGADSDQQLDEQRLFVGEVAVNRRPLTPAAAPMSSSRTARKPRSANSRSAAASSCERRSDFSWLRRFGPRRRRPGPMLP
ncbi:hypothetical protein I552_9338 [Mycobacterium xenopi 3993]|nr:hypothetical protein I552_9338 [Mycobacterium xenopi 3993]